MKSVKKIFVAFFALFVGIMLVSATTKAKAESGVANSTPWFITFDNGTVVNIREGETGIRVLANSFTISYFDTTGKTEGGYFDLWRENRMVETVEEVIGKQYVKNGETITITYSGHLTFLYYLLDDNGEMLKREEYGIYLDRSILTSDRIRTNFREGQYYYDSVFFDDNDDLWSRDNDKEWIIYNRMTGKMRLVGPYFAVSESGEYVMTIYDTLRDETLTYEFAIVESPITIELIECDWMEETHILFNRFTSKGVKVVLGGDYGDIQSISYRYKKFTASYYEEGIVDNGFTFYRKGEYTVTVTDANGNQMTTNFVINEFDIEIDPKGAGTVGTEVTNHGGAYGDTTMSVGYTRCLYLSGDAPSQSRLDYTFTSSDASIATVSAFGTVEAKRAGTVVITCVNKKNPSKVSKIVITVLP